MENYQKKIGCFIQIPNVGRGQLKYVGHVDGKSGVFVGVDLLANIGKNDGTFQGKQYFETEYAQSGLFIQLQKVATLIDNASDDSRRATMCDPFSKSRRTTLIDPRSPTPVRGNSRKSSAVSSDSMDVDSRDRRLRYSATKDYEIKFQQQQQEITRYKKLLDEQRVVLEEIQPAIDIYEDKLREMESEITRLQSQLEKERDNQRKQKLYFETEHEQLLSVVEELHHEIRENEQRMIEGRTRVPLHNDELYTGDDELKKENMSLKQEIEELRQYRLEQEKFRSKWEKEREQLKMHNDSLSSEYQFLNKEAQENERSLSSENRSLKEAIERITGELSLANERLGKLEMSSSNSKIPPPQANEDNQNIVQESVSESLPLYVSKTRDPSAGRRQWCALCERDGHDSVECPYENDQLF